MTIFTYVAVDTNDLEKARSFYDTVLGALRLQRIADRGENGVTVSFEAHNRATAHPTPTRLIPVVPTATNLPFLASSPPEHEWGPVITGPHFRQKRIKFIKN